MSNLNKTTLNMTNTMETMLRNEGVYVKVSIKKEGYLVSTDAVSHADGLSLFYIDSHTPGEVVAMVIQFFNKLNGKV